MATVLLELARAYQSLNEPERSMEYADRAHALYASLENMCMSMKVKLTAAVATGQAGHVEEAISQLENIMKKMHKMGKTEDAGIAYVELAKLQLASDDMENAFDSCRIARTLLPKLHLYQAWVNRILAEIEVKRVNRAEAARRLQMAADCFKTQGDIGEWAESMSKLS